MIALFSDPNEDEVAFQTDLKVIILIKIIELHFWCEDKRRNNNIIL